MKIRNPVVQVVVLVLAATVIAIVANGFAPRQRRLVLPGYYPNARQVPSPGAAPIAPLPALTSTVVETATIAPPPVMTTTTTAEAPRRAEARRSTTETLEVPQPEVKPATPAAPPVDPLARFVPHPDKPYVEIGGDDVAALYRAGVLFLDARRTSVFEEGHIAGARPFSVWESDIDDKVSALFNERSDPREQSLPIVIYCSGGACEDSHMLAQKLWGAQFNNVYVYKDGYPDWLKRDGATRSGPTP